MKSFSKWPNFLVNLKLLLPLESLYFEISIVGKQYQRLDKVYGFKKKDENGQIKKKEDDIKVSS